MNEETIGVTDDPNPPTIMISGQPTTETRSRFSITKTKPKTDSDSEGSTNNPDFLSQEEYVKFRRRQLSGRKLYPNKFHVNGCRLTQGVVNTWLKSQWVQLRMRSGGGSELALTPLGIEVFPFIRPAARQA